MLILHYTTVDIFYLFYSNYSVNLSDQLLHFCKLVSFYGVQ